MPKSVIYKHPSTDCPLCKVAKGKRHVKADSDETLRWRCHSLYVHGSNKNDAMWVLRCEERYKRCPGYKGHKRILKAFKSALAEVSRKSNIGRIVALPRLIGAFRVPSVKDNMNRQEPKKVIEPERTVEGCLEHYGFTRYEKTKKNRKKKMWKIAEDWFVRRV